MKLREGLVGMVAASALIVAAGAVEAKTVSVSGLTGDPDCMAGSLCGPFSVGGQWLVNFTETDNNTGATAQALWTFDDYRVHGSFIEWDFTLAMTNTTSTLTHPESRLTVFGWDNTPDAIYDDFAFSADDDATWFKSSGATAGGLGTFEICIKSAGTPNCTQGAGGVGIEGGKTTTFDMTITTVAMIGENTVDNLSFDRFMARWQSLGIDGEGSDVGLGTPAPIPLPGAGFLLLGAVGGLGWLKLRDRKAAA